MDPIVPALVLSKFLELGITEYGIKNGSFREGNPFITDRTTRITVNTAFMLSSPFIYKEIKKKNKKVAIIVSVSLIAANGLLIHHNLKLMKNVR